MFCLERFTCDRLFAVSDIYKGFLLLIRGVFGATIGSLGDVLGAD